MQTNFGNDLRNDVAAKYPHLDIKALPRSMKDRVEVSCRKCNWRWNEKARKILSNGCPHCDK